MFASTCLGSLSQIFKRTQIEMFFIGSKIPSMGLRLAKDAMALGQVSPEKEQIEIDALRAEMERILADLVSNSKLSELSQDMSDHILKHNQKNKKCDPCDEHEHPRDECDPCDLANLLSVGGEQTSMMWLHILTTLDSAVCSSWPRCPTPIAKTSNGGRRKKAKV